LGFEAWEWPDDVTQYVTFVSGGKCARVAEAPKAFARLRQGVDGQAARHAPAGETPARSAAKESARRDFENTPKST
jgi:hypothetical protein